MSAERKPVRVMHVGLGQIGAAIARAAMNRADLESVAAYDPGPAVAGKTLDEVCGEGLPAIAVRDRLAAAAADGAPQVALHAVASHIPDIEPQLIELVSAGLNVVTTAEELISPQNRYPEATARIDEAARAAGVTIFAAGVNPGVLMDRLPVFLSSLCIRIDGVRVSRLVDLGQRREALRRKMGVGAESDDVRARIEAGSIGHVGLIESLQHLAGGLGWQIGDIDEQLAPVIGETDVERAGESVPAGRVLGLHHTAVARAADGRPIELSLTMRLDAEEPVDVVEIDGEPPLRLRFEGGVAGDQATVATVLNGARFVVDAEPGLITRLPIPAGC
jgi:hypothetical protein